MFVNSNGGNKGHWGKTLTESPTIKRAKKSFECIKIGYAWSKGEWILHWVLQLISWHSQIQNHSTWTPINSAVLFFTLRKKPYRVISESERDIITKNKAQMEEQINALNEKVNMEKAAWVSARNNSLPLGEKIARYELKAQVSYE